MNKTHPVTIGEALRATCKELDLSPEAVAVAAKVSGNGARNWLASENAAIPSGDALLRLMRSIPSFANRLGFDIISENVAA